MPDELSRSDILDETQHVFNAALILRRVIQLLQPITPFPAEPADLSEEKLMYMFQVSGIISLMDNDCKSSGHGTLSEQESRARQLFFAHVFLDVLFSTKNPTFCNKLFLVCKWCYRKCGSASYIVPQ